MDIVNMEVREAGDGAAAGECLQSPPKKYTWAEVRQAVHDLRKELSSLSTMVPMAISFRKLSNGKTRVYFLRTPQNGWEITLLYTDITPTVQPNFARLEWKPLIESNVALGGNSGKWSREEQLLWERQRVAAWGIASYELHPASGRVLFPCASALFVAAPPDDGDHGWQSPPLVPRVVATGGGAPLTPSMCPRTPELVAHAARGDIWLAGGALRRPVRLTYACKGHQADRLADDPRQAGVPSYVTQEEFSRYTGFWWQPKSEDDTYRIVYEEVDESEVKIYSFPSSQSPSGDVEEFRFPRAGTANAKSFLRMVTFRLRKASGTTVVDYYQEGSPDPTPQSWESSGGGGGEWQEVCDVRWLDLRQPLHDSYPWFEYLPRVGWTPCGRYVWLQLLDRSQQRLELVLVRAEQFAEPFAYERAPPPPPPPAEPEPALDPALFADQILMTETAPNAWINVHDILHFLPREPDAGTDTDPDTEDISFIWASERTGHLHLYKCTCRLDTAKRKRPKLMEMMSDEESNALGPNIVSLEPITHGEWEVMPRKIWVDSGRGLVYFVGLRETPLERHLYAAPLSPPRPDALTLLTSPGHSCAPHLDEECTVAVITSSNISTLPCTRVYRIVHGEQGVALQPQGTLMERPSDECCSGGSSWNGSRESSHSADNNTTSTSETDTEIVVAMPGRSERCLSLAAVLAAPQMFCVRMSCGATAYCTLWRGRGAAAGASARRATVLHVYGGPEVQCVTNSYKGVRQLRMHMLAARGFNVVAIDSRGSKHRGRAWEACIRGRLGQVELDDQVEVLQWLAKETGCIDMERVAIHGWSYGGYLSLLGLATRPNTFKVCVAGAPVTCWRLYDTAYTERYMGSPARHAHAYTRASVLAHAPFLPDQEGRLLIIHGLADENVHFTHTAALLAELVRLGKPHRVQVYPGERHSLRAMHAAKHYEATLLHFLHENL